MSQQATTSEPQPTAATELHVFHYATHSTVVSITITSGPHCQGSKPAHQHTRDGRDMFCDTFLFLSATSAEKSIAQDKATHTEHHDVLGPLTVTTHRTLRPSAPAIATATHHR